jgi:hypothetical protein
MIDAVDPALGWDVALAALFVVGAVVWAMVRW